MEQIKEAMEHFEELVKRADAPQVLEICGKTYVNRDLRRYDEAPKARPVQARTLTALMDYMEHCSQEFPGRMIIHIVDPTHVRLLSELDAERERETLFETAAETSAFRFGEWYDQENFMIALQANFQANDDLAAVLKLAGNIVSKNDQTYSDDGTTQVATMTVGVASKADAIVPNPVTLIPYRTFQEVEQPESQFVFRIGKWNEAPSFKLVEAEGGLWRLAAVNQIKAYIYDILGNLSEEISEKVVVIG